MCQLYPPFVTAPMDSGGRSAHSRRSSSVGGFPMEAEGENPNSGSRYNSDIWKLSILWASICVVDVDMQIRLSIKFHDSEAFLFALVYSERNKESRTFWIREPRAKVVPKMLATKIPNFPTWAVFRLSTRTLSARDIRGLPHHTVCRKYHNRRVKCQFYRSKIFSKKENTDIIWGRKLTYFADLMEETGQPTQIAHPHDSIDNTSANLLQWV